MIGRGNRPARARGDPPDRVELESRRRALAAVSDFRGLRALRHRNFRFFITGQLVSLVGTWMQSVAQGWLVLDLTGDPFWLGVVAAAQFGPILVLGLFGGLIADGLPKRRTLVITQSASMLLAFTLFGLTATHTAEVGHIVVMALLLGCVNAVDMPTRQSFAVEMVGREDVGNAIALNSAVVNGARIVGPAIAGITIGATDISIAFLINGLSFMGVIAAFLLMDETQLSPAPRILRPANVRAVFTSLGEGISYIRGTPLVLMVISTVGVVSLFGLNLTVTVPAIAREILHADASGYGFLMTASGVGSLIVAVAIAFGRQARPALIGIGGAVLGAAQLVLAVSTSFPVSMLAMFIVGWGTIALAATANTVIQLNAPDHLRGRVMSVYTTVFLGSTPLGGLWIGSVASAFGVPMAVAIGGGGSLIAGIAGLLWWRRVRRSDVTVDGASRLPEPARSADGGAPRPFSAASTTDPSSVPGADTAATGSQEAAHPRTATG